jgi:hypothetical protein
MKTFLEFLAEQQLDEMFNRVPDAERDEDIESIMPMMSPEPMHDLQVHKVNGMSDIHRVAQFTNKNGEREFHIMNMFNPTAERLDRGGVEPHQAHAAYGFIFHHAQEALQKGQPVKLQSIHARQSALYKNAANRMVAKHGEDKYQVSDKGVQPTVQGWNAHTTMIEPK